MRRLLGICALAAAFMLTFGLSHQEATPAFAASRAASSEGASATSSAESAAGKTVVIADGVAARALGLDPSAALDLTSAGAPDRVFAMASALVTEATGPASVKTALTPIAGVGRAGSSGDGGAAIAAEFNLAPDSLSERSGIAIAPDGTIFIADSQNSTIRSIAGPSSSEPGIIRSVAGRWAPRQNVTLTTPMGVAVDRAGNLYIADKGADAVDVFVAATGRLETLAQVISPSNIAVTLDGTKVFVASPETGGVFAIATSTRAISGLAGFPAVGATSSTNASECPSFESGVIVAPKAQGICPAGLAVDGHGNLFVADANAGRILRVDAATNKISISATSLNVPGDIAFDPKGDLFVSEQGLSRIIELPQLGDPASAISLTTPPVFASPCPQVSNPFTFCNVPSGGTSQQAAFTLTNTSTNTVTGVTVAFIPATTPGNFTVESNGCTATLGKGQSCQINIAFTPQTTGALTATLSVTDSNPADAATVGLAGTGDDYSLQLASGQQIELTIYQGGTAVFNGQVVPDNVFGQDGESVQLVCPTSATMPVNTSCVITPCQAAITPGTPTPFKITFVTSSATSIAAVPPQGSGCTSYGPAPAMLTPGPRSPDPLDGRRFPPLLLLAGLAALALSLGWVGAAAGRGDGRKRLPIGFAMAGLAVATLIGCHHGNSTIAGPATPVGITAMAATGKAVDSNGNPLNTSRAMPQIMLDVITAPNGGGGFP
ncbi:MAG: choice-of-anchor D domain-containing protein [Candidatus Acidiferrales bacterium]